MKLGVMGGIFTVLALTMAGPTLGLPMLGIGMAEAALAAGVTLFGGGCLLGGGAGLLMGGARAVGRIRRADLYAEDLIKRDQIRSSAPRHAVDYRGVARARTDRENRWALQVMERQHEVQDDLARYR